jgi:hypothetical protein
MPIPFQKPVNEWFFGRIFKASKNEAWFEIVKIADIVQN